MPLYFNIFSEVFVFVHFAVQKGKQFVILVTILFCCTVLIGIVLYLIYQKLLQPCDVFFKINLKLRNLHNKQLSMVIIQYQKFENKNSGVERFSEQILIF